MPSIELSSLVKSQNQIHILFLSSTKGHVHLGYKLSALSQDSFQAVAETARLKTQVQISSV